MDANALITRAVDYVSSQCLSNSPVEVITRRISSYLSEINNKVGLLRNSFQLGEGVRIDRIFGERYSTDLADLERAIAGIKEAHAVTLSPDLLATLVRPFVDAFKVSLELLCKSDDFTSLLLSDDNTLSVVLPRITIQHDHRDWDMGELKVCIPLQRFCDFRNSPIGATRVFNLSFPMLTHAHPHVGVGHDVCHGDSNYHFTNVARSGDIYQLFMMYRSLLSTYGNNPFVPMDRWNPTHRDCAQCGRRTRVADLKKCVTCEQVVCPACMRVDPATGLVYCPAHAHECETCHTIKPNNQFHSVGRRGYSTPSRSCQACAAPVAADTCPRCGKAGAVFTASGPYCDDCLRYVGLYNSGSYRIYTLTDTTAPQEVWHRATSRSLTDVMEIITGSCLACDVLSQTIPDPAVPVKCPSCGHEHPIGTVLATKDNVYGEIVCSVCKLSVVTTKGRYILSKQRMFNSPDASYIQAWWINLITTMSNDYMRYTLLNSSICDVTTLSAMDLRAAADVMMAAAPQLDNVDWSASRIERLFNAFRLPVSDGFKLMMVNPDFAKTYDINLFLRVRTEVVNELNSSGGATDPATVTGLVYARTGLESDPTAVPAV